MIKPAVRYNANILEPYFPGEESDLFAVPLGPNQTLVAGTILGQVTASSVSQVQTLTFGGTVSGGTFTVTVADVNGNLYTTAALAYNISNANLKIALDALLASAGYIGASTTIGGGPCPTNATVTMGGTLAGVTVPLMVATQGLLTGSSPTLAITITTAAVMNGVFKPYNSGNSDGTQTALVILQMDCITDTLGGIVFGNQIPGEHYVKNLSAPCYYRGVFNVSDLTGLDSNGVSNLGRMIYGAYNVAGGIISVR
jgi:hypothetical protein